MSKGAGGRRRVAHQLVGRDGVLADLAAVLEAPGGRPRLLWIEGDAGTGKTSVLDVALAGAAGAALRTRAEPVDIDRPFAVATRLVDTTLPAVADDGVDDAGDDRSPVVERGEARPPDGRDGDGRAVAVPNLFDQFPGRRHRIAADLRRQVEELAGASPLVVVDDVQWADPSSLWVLEGLLEGAGELTVVVAGRPVPDPSPPAGRLARRAAEAGDRLVLGPLTDDEVGDLVRQLVGGRPGAGLRRWVGQAAGNPMLVTELVRSAERRGWLLRSRSGAEGSIPVELDERFAVEDLPPDLALSHLDELEEDEREVLRVASVLGVTFSPAHAAAMLGRPVATLVATLERLVGRELLVADGAVLRFRHDLVREAVYDEIAEWARAALHAHAATVLRDGGAPDPEVAHHLQRGAPVVDEATGATFERAGRALLHTDPVAARALLQRALELSPRPTDLLVAELVLATTWAGDPGEGERVARDHLAGPAATAGHPPPGSAHPRPAAGSTAIRHALAHNLMAQGRLVEAADEAEAVGAGLDGDERRRFLAEAALVRSLAFQHDAAARAAAAVLDGVDRAPAPNGVPVAVEAVPSGRTDVAACIAWCARSWLAAQAGRADDSIAAAEEAITAAADSSTALRYHPHYFLAQAQLLADRFDDFDRTATEGRALSARLGTVWQLPVWSSTIAAKHLRAGDWDKALAEAEVGLGWARDTGSRVGVPWLWCHRAVIALWRGDPDRAEDLLVRAEEELGTDLRPGADGVLWVRGLLAEEQGDPAAAVRSLGALWDLVEGLGVVARMPTIGPDVVRVALEAGDRDRAGRVVAALDRYAGTPGPASFAAGAQRCRGLLEADADALVEASARYEGSPATVEAAMADAEAAEALARAGATRRAGAHARASLDRFDRMGAALLRRRLERTLEDVPAVALGSPERDPRSLLSPAELRVAGLVAAGASNPEVAAALHVSRRTVESHLSHIFTKLGIRSRVDLAVLLADHR